MAHFSAHEQTCKTPKTFIKKTKIRYYFHQLKYNQQYKNFIFNQINFKKRNEILALVIMS